MGIISIEDLRTLNEARSILDRLEASCAKQRSIKPDNYVDADAYDHGRLAEAADHAENAIFQAINIMSAYRVQRVDDRILHNEEKDPSRPIGRADSVELDSNEDGFELTIYTERGTFIANVHGCSHDLEG